MQLELLWQAMTNATPVTHLNVDHFIMPDQDAQLGAIRTCQLPPQRQFKAKRGMSTTSKRASFSIYLRFVRLIITTHSEDEQVKLTLILGAQS
jgi:hypothetical protein